MGGLVFAYGNKERSAGLAVHDDVGGLQCGIAEEAVGVEVFFFYVFDLLFVGGDAFEPAQWSDHAEQQVEFGVFGDKRLLENDGFLRVEAGGEIVGHDFDGVLRDGGGVSVVAGEGVPVGNEEETFVGWSILQADPVLQRAEIVADVQFA